jgi:Holliday junction DNA helicase RuvA
VYDFLRGRIAATGTTHAVLDVGGVGWLLHVPTALALRLRVGEEARLLVHLVVGESALTLYGFDRELERRLFRRLIQVSGVGPTRALEVMSSIPTEPLVRAIVDADVQRLTAVRGIGRKTAERLVVEMRDRVKGFGEMTAVIAAGGGTQPAAIGPQAEAFSALVALGYKPAEVTRLLKGVDASVQTTEELIRRALQAAVAK